MSPVTNREFSGHDDFMAVRQFLIDSYSGFDRLFNWGIDRWDVLRYTTNAAGELSGQRDWEQYVRVWEDNGRVVGVIHPEDGGDLHVEIDAGYRHLEDEMYGWGEGYAAPSFRDGSLLVAYTKAHDDLRNRVLKSRGWQLVGPAGYTRRRSLTAPLPQGPVAAGYAVRTVDIESPADAETRAAISRAAFGSSRTAELAQVIGRAPTYRPDLDLGAFAADGSLAAHTTVWWDEANRFTVFEPVATHPDHRRLGLASAVMAEGMRRGVALGATMAYVGSGEGSPANLLYEALGFVDADQDFRWELPDRVDHL